MRNIILNHIIKVVPVLFMIAICLGMSKQVVAQLPKEERTSPPMEQLPQEQNQLAVNYNDEIKKDELPESVSVSLDETYPGFEIKEIFRGSDGSYKVKLEKEKSKIAAYYNAGGEFLRIEEDIDEDTMNDDWR